MPVGSEGLFRVNCKDGDKNWKESSVHTTGFRNIYYSVRHGTVLLDCYIKMGIHFDSLSVPPTGSKLLNRHVDHHCTTQDEHAVWCVVRILILFLCWVRLWIVRLGKSGLKVSKIILGCMSYGSSEWQDWVLPEEEGIKHIKAAYDAGIQTFDTAGVRVNSLTTTSRSLTSYLITGLLVWIVWSHSGKSDQTVQSPSTRNSGHDEGMHVITMRNTLNHNLRAVFLLGATYSCRVILSLQGK